MRILFSLVFAIVLAASPLTHAQQSSGSFARMVVWKPKPGQSSQFSEGYKRHLVWHKDNKDPWTWYGWTFVLGERIGEFMDGTFGHAITDFDKAVDPPADAADNNTNVVPFADIASHGVFERIEGASTGQPLPDTTPYLALSTYLVVPGQESAFEATIRDAAKRASNQRMAWFRLTIGGETPQYVLMRPAQTFAAAGALPQITLPAGLVRSAKSELLRFQPELSYIP
jgi:hypothetical protein